MDQFASKQMEIGEVYYLRPKKHFWSPGTGWTEAIFACWLCNQLYDIRNVVFQKIWWKLQGERYF